MNDPFKYVPPTPEMVPHFETIARHCADLYRSLMEHVPESPERTLAIRKLQEVRMWANAAISGVSVETRGQTYR
jgi:hypothetical protein